MFFFLGVMVIVAGIILTVTVEDMLKGVVLMLSGVAMMFLCHRRLRALHEGKR
jgi:hypothetical protein